MKSLVRLPGILRLNITLVTALVLLTNNGLLAQSAEQNDINALKAQIQEMQQQNQQMQQQNQRMQKEYEDRISAMESTMQSLKSRGESGSILNTHVLTDADGKQYEGKGPVLDESFLKSLTRNFTFSAYVRAGVQFNGSGGGGNFHFEVPDNLNSPRVRLGNENDIYMELTWAQAHMLGDNPDVMDVSMTFTPAIRQVQTRNTFQSQYGAKELTGNDYDFVWRNIYVEAKNVFKSAPEVNFWIGERLYDRIDIDPIDYHWLDMSGYGAGVQNIDVGIGNLWVAYLGGLDLITSPRVGSFYKHSLDVRLKDLDIGPGKLMLVGIANYEKGSTFTSDFAGNTLTNPVRTDDAYGLGGGAVYRIDLSAIGPNSFLQLQFLAGFGATNFNVGTDVGAVTGFSSNFLIKNPTTPAGVVVNAGEAIQNERTFKIAAYFIWNPNPSFSMSLYGLWNQDSAGFRLTESFANPRFPTATVFKSTPGTRNIWQVGIRPYFWITDNIAIQGQAYGAWVDNVRGWQANFNPDVHPGTLNPTAFGRSGEIAVFTIAPTIKPKGGYFSRPEFRVFATYSIWSNSFKGATTPLQEGGNTGGFTPSPYANAHANQGWLIGTQTEWFF